MPGECQTEFFVKWQDVNLPSLMNAKTTIIRPTFASAYLNIYSEHKTPNTNINTNTEPQTDVYWLLSCVREQNV